MQPVGDITIASAFNGPPSSGNGGYAAGVLSRLFETPHTVRISAPIPLDTPLAVTRQKDKLVAASGETPILTARPGGVTLTPPAPPSLEAALKAAETPTYFGAGGASTCFVCGRNRKEGDGLHIHCGRLGDKLEAATVWTPHVNFDDGTEHVRPEYVWAALDCPGGFALPEIETTYLLGEMSAAQHKPVPVGQPVIVHAWHEWTKGRKHFAGTSLHAADGTLLAQADTLWIELTPEQAGRLVS
ncbi:hypothetical protein [Hyphomonas sp.]|uniref:hypothetical protein n=1 Tax=Hyphomonas sp. TaxID=87 RepID=UPI003529A0D7